MVDTKSIDPSSFIIIPGDIGSRGFLILFASEGVHGLTEVSVVPETVLDSMVWEVDAFSDAWMISFNREAFEDVSGVDHSFDWFSGVLMGER